MRCVAIAVLAAGACKPSSTATATTPVRNRAEAPRPHARCASDAVSVRTASAGDLRDYYGDASWHGDGLVVVETAERDHLGIERISQREWSADLDGDGLVDTAVADTAGANHGENRYAVLLACGDDAYVPLLLTDYVDGSLRPAASRTQVDGHRWRDLVLEQGEPAHAEIVGSYVFDGRRYVEASPRRP